MTVTDFGESIDLNGKSILVTGGTGSFGRRFVRKILDNFTPSRLVVFSRDEHKHYDMANDFAADASRLRYFVGDVRDLERLNMAFRGIDYVIHAAALKHVHIAEYNPFECIHTNVIGAEHVVRAAITSNVKKVIALSTDKACSPVNLYGASKLASDKIFVAAGNLAGRGGPTFSVVRYGNVVGSRGSVVPFFQKLLREGARELPITDPQMTRFWISLDQSVDFVLSNMRLMRGGEIFVPKIPSMKITDLAESMAPGMPTKVIGIRPGEKLHEAMIVEDDAANTMELDDRYVIEPSFPLWDGNRSELSGSRPVPTGFKYASNTNDQWISEAELSQMIDAL